MVTRLGAGEFAAVRAALAGGASPVAAVTQISDGPLAAAGSALRLGHSLGDVARGPSSGDVHADLLLRALAVVERTGSGGVVAVDQAARAAAEEAAVVRVLRIKTAQARGTARMLAALPLVVFTLFALVEPGLLAYYGTPIGWVTGGGAVALMLAGHAWGRRIVGRAAHAAAAADPLTAPPGRADLRRGLALAVPGLLVAGLGAGPLVGLAVGGVLLALGARPGGGASAPGAGHPEQPSGGGAAETIELVAIALRAGLPPVGALEVVAPLAPPAARPLLEAAGRRLRGGWGVRDALADTALAPLGAALGASERWGAPAHDALERLATDVRAERRAAAEEAAERTQLTLIFPTTLLTLPAFVLAVVPPMVWSALAGWGGAA